MTLKAGTRNASGDANPAGPLNVAATDARPTQRAAAGLREKLASVPVIKSGLSLMTGTMVTSGLGLIFWILAANLYEPADFGVSTTAIYTMMMLADVACLGLRTGLVRYVPKAGSRTGGTILWGYVLVLAASVVTAAVFLAGLGWWAPDLIELRNSGLLFIFFVASTAFWALFMLEDAVLVGLRRATWVPIENSLFGILKIILLFPFAALSPTLGIFWAWTLPVFPIVIGVNVFVRRLAKDRAGTGRDDGAPARSLLRDILSFSIADWFAAVARLAALGVIPLMVLAKLDKAEAGYFQASWLIAFTIFALSSNAAYALLAETSYEQSKLHRNSVQAGLLSLALTVPIILVGVIGAPLLLRIYGADYAENSATVLRILLIAAVPNVIHQIFIGRLRSQGRMAGVVLFETLLSVLVLTMAWLFLPRYGINGIGLAWLLGLGVLAAYALGSETLWWWADRIDTRFVRRVGGAFRRLRGVRPARGMDSRLDEVLGEVLGAGGAPGAEVSWLHRGEDGQTVIVAAGPNRRLVIEFARSSAGATELDRRRRTIERLADDPRLTDLARLLPELSAHSCAPAGEYLTCSQPTGPTALERLRSGTPIEAVCRAALDSIQPLHDITGTAIVVDEEIIERWIGEPIARLATAGRASAGDVEQVRRILVDGFAGRVTQVGEIHGELALDNIVMAPGDEPTVIALLAWDRSTELPLIVDGATLALSDLAFRGHDELGAVVRSLLSDPTSFEEHPAMVSRDRSIPIRAVLILAWLHLVGRPLPPPRTMSSDVFWLARNARPVLAALALVGSDR